MFQHNHCQRQNQMPGKGSFPQQEARKAFSFSFIFPHSFFFTICNSVSYSGSHFTPLQGLLVIPFIYGWSVLRYMKRSSCLITTASFQRMHIIVSLEDKQLYEWRKEMFLWLVLILSFLLIVYNPGTGIFVITNNYTLPTKIPLTPVLWHAKGARSSSSDNLAPLLFYCISVSALTQ